jgi:hypothetical protein
MNLAIPVSLIGLTGQSSNPCAIGVAETLSYRESGGYWIARLNRAMTVVGVAVVEKGSSRAAAGCPLRIDFIASEIAVQSRAKRPRTTT